MPEDSPSDRINDKREYYRLVYLEEERPVLKIGRHAFRVMDISQGGLRFLNPKTVRLDEWVKGKLSLSCGEIIPLEGRIEWMHDDEFGLLLDTPISATAMEKERLYLFHP